MTIFCWRRTFSRTAKYAFTRLHTALRACCTGSAGAWKMNAYCRTPPSPTAQNLLLTVATAVIASYGEDVVDAAIEAGVLSVTGDEPPSFLCLLLFPCPCI